MMTSRSASVTNHSKQTIYSTIKTYLEHLYTLKNECRIATFSILTTEKAEHIKPINPAPLRHLLDTIYDDVVQ